MKCDNCGETSNCFLPIWIPQKKRWGEEWIQQKICYNCWETIVTQEIEIEEEEEEKSQIIDEQDRLYICNYLCNLKDCSSLCPLKEDKDEYSLSPEDIESICSFCRHVEKECDENCPLKEKSQ